MSIDELIVRVAELAEGSAWLGEARSVRERRASPPSPSRCPRDHRAAGDGCVPRERVAESVAAVDPGWRLGVGQRCRREPCLHGSLALPRPIRGSSGDRVHGPRGARERGACAFSAKVHSSSWCVNGDLRRVDGLPVTSPERTIIDLARANVATPLLEAAIDSAIRLRLTTLEHIIDRVEVIKGPGRRGVARLDELILTSGGHSLLERRFLKLVREAELAMPIPQVVHRREGRHVARVDFLFPAAESRGGGVGRTRSFVSSRPCPRCASS